MKNIKKIGIIGLGCPKNIVDTEVMAGLLKANNFIITNNEDDADIIVINTCAFIKLAEKEAKQIIRKVISRNKHKKIIVTGCLVQKYKDEVVNMFPEVHSFLGSDKFYKIVDVLNNINHEKILYSETPEFLYNDKHPRVLTTSCGTAYLKISEGCSHKCSFCIIPDLRGKYRSREFTSIIKEAENLAKNGVKELSLVAQDTTYYGTDLYGRKRLAELLKELAKIDDIVWIRVLYTYPNSITNELIDTIAEEKKICNYVDLPIQHISDNVLTKMRRFSTKKKVKEIISYIKNADRKFCIRTTFLVGHPGETEEDFYELLLFVQSVKFDRVGVFMYSDEKLSRSYNLYPKVPPKIAKIRYHKLMKVQQKISLSRNREFIGDVMQVLIEKEKEGYYLGRSYRDAQDIDGVVFVKKLPDLKIKIPEFVNVRITKAYHYDLEGEIIQNSSTEKV